MLYWNTTNKQSLRKHNTQNFLNRITLLKSWEASCSLDKEVQYPFPSIISPVNKKHREKNGHQLTCTLLETIDGTLQKTGIENFPTSTRPAREETVQVSSNDKTFSTIRKITTRSQTLTNQLIQRLKVTFTSFT